jgi:hypothetical protein
MFCVRNLGGPGGVRGDSVAGNGLKIGIGCRLIGFELVRQCRQLTSSSIPHVARHRHVSEHPIMMSSRVSFEQRHEWLYIKMDHVRLIGIVRSEQSPFTT